MRKAEVRLAEHRELREALGLDTAPDYTILHRFLNRLEERVLVRALGETVRCGASPSRHAHHDDQQQESQSIVAVDATGLSPGAISTFYVQRTQNRDGKPMLWRKWLKWLVLVDTQSQLVLAQEACSGPYNGSAMLRPLRPRPHERLLHLAWSWRTQDSTASTTTATCTNGSER